MTRKILNDGDLFGVFRDKCNDNFEELFETPPGSAPVDSVNSKVGVVVLDKTDIGLDQVDNTSDVNKPVSNATQIELNKKANTADLGTASAEDVGTTIGDVVQLEDVGGSAGLPAVDGSQLTNLPASGHTIQDEGTPLTKRTKLNFIGAGVTATDNAGNDSTDVTIPSGIQTIVEPVATVKAMIDITTPADGDRVSVTGFYANTIVGGGEFEWDSSADKATANGGTIIDPDNIGTWDGTQAQLAAQYYGASGQGTGAGTGCWVRVNYENTDPKDFGALYDGAADDYAAWLATHNATQIKQTMFISGPLYFTTPIVINRRYDIETTNGGYFKPDVTTSFDAITASSTEVNNVTHRYKVFGLANSCRNAVIYDNVHNSIIDVVVKTGTTEYGYTAKGCFLTEHNVMVTNNYGPFQSLLPSAVMPENYMLLGNGTAIAAGNNGSTFNVILEGGTGNGIVKTTTNKSSKVKISGTIQGIGGNPINVSDGTSWDFSNLYIEANGFATNSAYATTLTPEATTGSVVKFTLGAGSWSSADIHRKIEHTAGNGEAEILTVSGAVAVCKITEAFPSTAAIASGDWALRQDRIVLKDMENPHVGNGTINLNGDIYFENSRAIDIDSYSGQLIFDATSSGSYSGVGYADDTDIVNLSQNVHQSGVIVDSTSLTTIGARGTGANSTRNWFHNPFMDIWTAGTSSAPDGVTSSAATFAKETTTTYPKNPYKTSALVQYTGSSITTIPEIKPAAPYLTTQEAKWMSATVALYVPSGQEDLYVYLYDTSVHNLISVVTEKDQWVLVTGAASIGSGKNVSVKIGPYNGSAFTSGNFYIGGVNIVDGVVPNKELADDSKRFERHVTNISAPPSFIGQRALVSSEWYAAKGTSASSDWVKFQTVSDTTVPKTAHNKLSYPWISAEATGTYWGTQSGSGVYSRSSEQSLFGGFSLKVEHQINAQFAYLTNSGTSNIHAIKPNQKWILSGYVYTTKAFNLIPRIWTGGTTTLHDPSVGSFDIDTINQWVRFEGVYDLTADANYKYVIAMLTTLAAAETTGNIYFDGLMLEPASDNQTSASIVDLNPETLYGSKQLTIAGPIVDGASSASNTITVYGAEVGDSVFVTSASDNLPLVLYPASVTAPDTVTFNVFNHTGADHTPTASAEYLATVTRYTT